MSMTDTISDMLTRIRNGQKSKLLFISFPHSNTKCSILNTLIEEGYISKFEMKKMDNKNLIEVELKYSINGLPAISEIIKVSKPGKRIYSSINKLRSYYNNMGIYIISTSKGIISDRKARLHGIGGEIICKVF